MFYILLISFNYNCKAPLKLPEPLKEGNISKVILLTRHGCRAPFDGYGDYQPNNWNCDSNESISPRMTSISTNIYRRFLTKLNNSKLPYPPSCKKADLTLEGMKQHFELGNLYKNYLQIQLNLLPDYYDQNLVYFRSSEPERCIRSTESFIHSFYPPIFPDEIIPITTGTDQFELLHPRFDHCKDLNIVYQKWIKSTKYLSKKKLAEPYLRPLIENSGLIWDDWQWLWVGDWIYTIGCCGSPLPSFLNQTIIDIAIDAVEFFTLDFFTFEKGVAGSSIMREIIKNFDNFLNRKTDIKFNLLTAHDVSIVSLLDLLDIKLIKIPPFASHLLFELYNIKNEYFIRINLNGEILLNIKYSLLKLKISNYLNYCLELGE